MAITEDVVLGENVTVHNPDQVNFYGCKIGRETRIGSFVEIQRGVVIGERCKIQSHSFICTGVTIEDAVFIGHGVIFSDDYYPRATNDDGSVRAPRDWVMIPTLVKQGASIGNNATIICNVVIGEFALVGAGSVVTKDVPPYAIVAGNPARVVGSTRDKKEREPRMHAPARHIPEAPAQTKPLTPSPAYGHCLPPILKAYVPSELAQPNPAKLSIPSVPSSG